MKYQWSNSTAVIKLSRKHQRLQSGSDRELEKLNFKYNLDLMPKDGGSKPTKISMDSRKAPPLTYKDFKLQQEKKQNTIDNETKKLKSGIMSSKTVPIISPRIVKLKLKEKLIYKML